MLRSDWSVPTVGGDLVTGCHTFPLECRETQGRQFALACVPFINVLGAKASHNHEDSNPATVRGNGGVYVQSFQDKIAKKLAMRSLRYRPCCPVASASGRRYTPQRLYKNETLFLRTSAFFSCGVDNPNPQKGPWASEIRRSGPPSQSSKVPQFCGEFSSTRDKHPRLGGTLRLLARRPSYEEFGTAIAVNKTR